MQYKILVLSYILAIFPVSWIIDIVFVKSGIQTSNHKQQVASRIIGYFERIIVLTFVLLNQYTALSIVVATKAIRFKKDIDTDFENRFLAGTFISVACAIIIGLITKKILGHKLLLH